MNWHPPISNIIQIIYKSIFSSEYLGIRYTYKFTKIVDENGKIWISIQNKLLFTLSDKDVLTVSVN